MKTKIGRDRQELLDSKRNREKQNDAEIQGEITGAIYRNGPISSRSCTDTLFCALYLFFLALLFSISIYAYVEGDITYIYTGYDSDDGACGVGSRADYPYLYFASPETNISMTVCVSECPTSSDSTLNCYVNSVITDCSTSEIYSSTEYNDVACIPTDASLYAFVSAYLSQGYWETFVEIFEDNWIIYLLAVGFSFCLTFFLLLLLLFFPKCVTWTFVVASVTLLLVSASLFMILYADPTMLSSSISSDAISDEFKLAISIILFIVSILSIIYIFFKMKKLAAAIAFMETTSLYLKQIWTSFCLPLIFLIIVWVYVLIAGYLCLLIYTIGDVYKDSDTTSPFGLIFPSTEGWIFLAIHLLGTFFNLSFIVCTYLFLLNGASSYWYFSTITTVAGQSAILDESKKPVSTSSTPKIYPLWESTKLYFKYHIGSVFVGSVLISLFSWFNYLFGHLYNKIAKWRDYAAAKSCIHIFLTGVLCLFYFYEKFIRYISRNAFVQMTITGSNFYQSSKDAFQLVQRNNNSYYPIQGLGDFIIFMGQLFIILATSITSFIIAIEFFAESVETSLEVCAIAMIISYASCNLTMLVFSAINDAVLVNYLLDVEIEINNYGKSEPYHAPAPLKAFLADPQHQKDLIS